MSELLSFAIEPLDAARGNLPLLVRAPEPGIDLLEAFAELMNDNWSAQKALHPDITNADIERLHERTFAAGAVGFKANGAGGGGTVTILAQRNKDHLVRRAVEELGMTVLPSKLDSSGLRVWETR